MSQAKLVEKQVARQLRREGWSVRRIARTIEVSQSSVSVWTGGISSRTGLMIGESARLEPEPEFDDGRRRDCGRCNRTLPLAAFNRNRDGYQWWCRECFRAYFRSRGDLHRSQVRASQDRRRERARDFLRKYLRATGCVDCGLRDDVVLEFDHVGAKSKNVSTMSWDGASIGALKREIAKCQVVCVNCHRHRTYSRRPSWRSDPTLLQRNERLTRGELRNMGIVIETLAATPCVDCGEADTAVLEFDHVGTKTDSVMVLAKAGCSEARLRAELAQCEVRCANCHRRRTLNCRRWS